MQDNASALTWLLTWFINDGKGVVLTEQQPTYVLWHPAYYGQDKSQWVVVSVHLEFRTIQILMEFICNKPI